MNHHLVILAAVWLAAGTCCAQPAAARAEAAPAASEPREAARTIRFYCMGTEQPQLFYEARKNHPTEILGALGSLSSAFPMPAAREFEIYRKILPPADAPPGTEPLKQVLASVKIPSGFGKAIILLLPAGDAKTGTLRVAAYGDSYQLHPRQTVRVFNLAAVEIGLKVNGTLESFKAGQDGVMPWVGGPAHVVVYQTAVRSGDQWRVVGTNERAVRPNLRAFMFAYSPDMGGSAPQIYSNLFYDSVPDTP